MLSPNIEVLIFGPKQSMRSDERHGPGKSLPEVFLPESQFWISRYEAARVFVAPKTVLRHESGALWISRDVLDKRFKRSLHSLVVAKYTVVRLMLETIAYFFENRIKLFAEKLRCFELAHSIIDSDPQCMKVFRHKAINQTCKRLPKRGVRK